MEGSSMKPCKICGEPTASERGLCWAHRLPTGCRRCGSRIGGGILCNDCLDELEEAYGIQRPDGGAVDPEFEMELLEAEASWRTPTWRWIG